MWCSLDYQAQTQRGYSPCPPPVRAVASLVPSTLMRGILKRSDSSPTCRLCSAGNNEVVGEPWGHWDPRLWGKVDKEGTHYDKIEQEALWSHRVKYLLLLLPNLQKGKIRTYYNKGGLLLLPKQWFLTFLDHRPLWEFDESSKRSLQQEFNAN